MNKNNIKTRNVYNANLYPNYNYNYSLYRKSVLLSGECKIRQATQEELDKYSNKIK